MEGDLEMVYSKHNSLSMEAELDLVWTPVL